MRTIYACIFEWGTGNERKCVFATQDRGHFIMHQEQGIHEAADYGVFGVQSVKEDAPELDKFTPEPEPASKPEPETTGTVLAEAVHMGLLGKWIGFEDWGPYAPAKRAPVWPTVRAGKLEAFALPQGDDGSGVRLYVNGAEYQVPRKSHLIWRDA